ncbi:slc35b2, partial [Symbiodinium natans]
AETQIPTSAAWCVFYGAGIIGTLVLYGILQEGIMTVAYDGNLFQYSVFLVLCNRLAAVVFAVCMAASKGESMQNAAPLWKYLIVSLSNVYASSCQYEALKYVSFAVQMLGKSFKMMPVMIWGIIISGKAYSGRDWLVALSVTLGCTEFLMTGPTHSKVDAGNSFKGFLLLGCFLALDGLTSTFQEKLFKEHKTTKYNQMLYINLLSATVSLITLLVTGEFAPAVAFGFAHPQFWLDSALLSASAVASQFFIYSQIKEFGALVFAATMNVRQVVSILVSYLKYHNPVTPLQILGLALIFSALFYKSAAAMLEAPSKEEKKPILEDAKTKAEEAIETSTDKDAGKVV